MLTQQISRRLVVVATPAYTQIIQVGSGTVIVPAGYTQLVVKMVGHGAGGSRSNSAAVARGGGGGGKTTQTIALSGDAGKSLAYNCGTPGAGRSGANGNGFDATNMTLDIDPLTNGVGVLTCVAALAGKLSVNGVGGSATGTGTNLSGVAGTAANGGASADGAVGGVFEGGAGAEYGGGGGPGSYEPSDRIQYSGGDGALGVISLTWNP